MSNSELVMTFHPNTIEHLGVRMYSTLPPVLAELIANAYDADAQHVTLKISDENEEKEIVIEDDGEGMSFDDINDKFLRIGRNRRYEEKNDTTSKGRKVIGKKGLGKLSFFGIAHDIEISTKKDGKENAFRMRWEDIKPDPREHEHRDYRPKIITKNSPCSHDDQGTTIALRKIQRTSNFEAEDIAISLARQFITDANFEVKIVHNSKEPIFVSNEKRFAGLDEEIAWQLPGDCGYLDDYEYADQIVGRLIATKKPISSNTEMRGITLFARKKLVNAPEYFSDSTSSHFFSYLTGWLEVDFIDEMKDDVIATNRQALNTDNDQIQQLWHHLRGLLNWLQNDWRDKREAKRKNHISKATQINIPAWLNTMSDDERENTDSLMKAFVRDSELPEETNIAAVRILHDIIPEYPKYHWRHLHPEIKAVSASAYKNGEYYAAFYEAVKRYMNQVRRKSGWPNYADANMMDAVFGTESEFALQVAQHIANEGNSNIHPKTIQNIQEGQRFLSRGVVTGGRNPLSHEESTTLGNTGLFTEKDCLDALSLLSHLFTRLENARKKS